MSDIEKLEGRLEKVEDKTAEHDTTLAVTKEQTERNTQDIAGVVSQMGTDQTKVTDVMLQQAEIQATLKTVKYIIPIVITIFNIIIALALKFI